MRWPRNIKTQPSIVHNLQDILRHEGSVKMSDVNIMKQMRCISNPFFTSERLVGVNYERHLKRIFRFGQNLKKRTLSIGGRWDSMAIIIKTWERFGQKVADESQHSGNHYSWQFAGKSGTCLSLWVLGGHLTHRRLECHIEIQIIRLCCQKFLLALLALYTGATLFLTLLSEHTCEIWPKLGQVTKAYGWLENRTVQTIQTVEGALETEALQKVVQRLHQVAETQ